MGGRHCGDLLITPRDNFIALKLAPNVPPAVCVGVISREFQDALYLYEDFKGDRDQVLMPVDRNERVRHRIIIKTVFSNSLRTLFGRGKVFGRRSMGINAARPTCVVIRAKVARMEVQRNFFEAPNHVRRIFHAYACRQKGLFSVGRPRIIAFTVPRKDKAVRVMVSACGISLTLNFRRRVITFTNNIQLLNANGSPLHLTFKGYFDRIIIVPNVGTTRILKGLHRLRVVRMRMRDVCITITLILGFGTYTLLRERDRVTQRANAIFEANQGERKYMIMSLVPTLSRRETSKELCQEVVITIPVRTGSGIISTRDKE